MSANQEAKKVLVEEIKENLKQAKSVVFLDYTGLSGNEAVDLRKKATKAGVIYKVYKNRLMLRALNELGITGFDAKHLEGTTSVAFGQDEVSASKIVVDGINDYGKMSVKFGLLDGRVIDEAEIKQLAKTPSKEVLIAMLLSALNGPMSALCRALDAIAKKN